MLVKEYPNAHAFLNDYEMLLLEQESSSQLVYYIAYYNSQVQEADNIVFGAVILEQEPLLLFCHIEAHNLVIYSVTKGMSAFAAEALADYYGNNKARIKGIVAELNICQKFIEKYKIYHKDIFKEVVGIDIMELRSIGEIKPAQGTCRKASSEDAKLVAEWMIDFQMEALTSEMDYEAALQKAICQIKAGNIYFYENEEPHIVSMAIAERRLPHGTTITYVYTPEEYRGRGYAAANIYFLSKQLLDQGNEFCTLFVNKKNPLSTRAYEKVGYRIIGDFYEYKVVAASDLRLE